MSKLLHEILVNVARSRPERPAIIEGDRITTYAELERLGKQLATGMHASTISRGDRIAIYLPKQLETVISVLGASRVGGIFVPINPVLKPEQVLHILEDSGARMLITSTARITTLRSAISRCRSLEVVVSVDKQADDASPDESVIHFGDLLVNEGELKPNTIDIDPVAILYTSGSTGKPKGVVLSHRNMVAGAESVASYLGNSEHDTILAALPFSFDAGLSQLTTALISGARIVLLNYLLPQDVLRAAEKHSVTGITGVPPLWHQLSALNWPAEVAANMRYIASTGGSMPMTTLHALQERFPTTDIFLMYGLTESFRATFLPPEQLAKRPNSIGKAIPNTEVLVVNDDGDMCGPNEPGELVHRGALVALGYWKDPDRTARRFRPAPAQAARIPPTELTVWSGDVVKTDEEGFLYFVGRRDDMIKSSGYRISPTEVEEVVYSCHNVAECAVIGIPDDALGQAVAVAYTSEKKEDECTAEIIAACKRELPSFMTPTYILKVENLPRNPNGKIDRKRIAGDEVFLRRIVGNNCGE